RGRPYSFFFSSRRRHTRWPRDWSSDVCSSDLSSATAHVGKVLTNPKDVAHGVEEGIHALLDEAGVSSGEVRAVVHGTTLATNARSEERRVGKSVDLGGGRKLKEKRVRAIDIDL